MIFIKILKSIKSFSCVSTQVNTRQALIIIEKLTTFYTIILLLKKKDVHFLGQSRLARAIKDLAVIFNISHKSVHLRSYSSFIEKLVMQHKLIIS